MAIPRNLANIAPHVAGSSGGITGLTFNATQSAFADANTLDDYEEGTWTPTFYNNTGAVITPSGGSLNGSYIKIGKLVFIRFHTYGISNLANVRKIQGQPFSISATTTYGSGGIVAGQHGPSGAQRNLTIPTLSIVTDATVQGFLFSTDYSFPTSGTNIGFTWCYETTA